MKHPNPVTHYPFSSHYYPISSHYYLSLLNLHLSSFKFQSPLKDSNSCISPRSITTQRLKLSKLMPSSVRRRPPPSPHQLRHRTSPGAQRRRSPPALSLKDVFLASIYRSAMFYLFFFVLVWFMGFFWVEICIFSGFFLGLGSTFNLQICN